MKFAVLIIVIVAPGVSLAPTNSTASVSYSDTKHWEEKFQILFHSQPSLSYILLAQVISGWAGVAITGGLQENVAVSLL